MIYKVIKDKYATGDLYNPIADSKYKQRDIKPSEAEEARIRLLKKNVITRFYRKSRYALL